MNTLEKTEQIINKVLEDPMHFWEVPFVMVICLFVFLMLREITKDDMK